MCRSQKAAERTYVSVKSYVEKKLFLKFNETKTKVCHLSDDVKFLGFALYVKSEKRRKAYSGHSDKWGIAVHRKKLAEFKRKVKELLDRRCTRGLQRTKSEFASYIRGWIIYFWYGLSNSLKAELDGWIRRRIRQLYRKIWKKNKTKEAALLKLGMKPHYAHAYANTSKSYWRIAGARILSCTLKNEVLPNLSWIWPGSVRIAA